MDHRGKPVHFKKKGTQEVFLRQQALVFTLYPGPLSMLNMTNNCNQIVTILTIFGDNK